MKFVLKIAVIIVVFILLISSIYVVFYTDFEETESTDDMDDHTDNETDDGAEDENGDVETDDEDGDDFVGEHTVFVEEGTGTWCEPCVDVAEFLHELYDPDDPDFYYVSMVDDKSTKAHNRLHDEYNILGFPTVFIDGGYRVTMGKKEKSEYRKQISEAKSRDVPKLLLNVNSTWNQNKTELTTTVTIENKETDIYKGRLKVYVTEINSRWSDWNGDPYHFAFLGYAIDKDVEIEANDKKTFPEKWDASSSGFSDVFPENLMVFAVVFNSEKNQGYSKPPDKNPFDAYYADAADATRVREGGLPPTIGIAQPRKGRHYLPGKEPSKSLLGKTIIIGPITIKTNIQAEAGVEKVEFTLKKELLGEITKTVTSEPYEWTWDTLSLGRYTITVKLYDTEGKIATDSIDVIAFILGEKFI